MSIRIDGTNTTANPGITGSDTDTGLQFGTNEVKVVTDGSDRVTVDSSGRLLAGTTSNSGNFRAVFEGNAGNAAAGGDILLCRGSTTPLNGQALGLVGMSDDTQTISAQVQAFRDGGTWSSSSKPTALRFSTAADGGTSMTERMRILSGGGLTFNGDTAQANALNDYEEGSWTPTAAGGHTGITVDTNNCVYVKVGKMVTLTFEIYYPTGLSGSLFKIGGVPFAIDEETIGSVLLNSADFPANRTSVNLYGHNSELRLYASGSGVSWGGFGGDDVTSDASILGTIIYRST